MKKTNSIVLLVLLVLTSMLGLTFKGFAAEESKELVVGNDGATDGIAIYNKEQELEGFEIDFWNEIGKKLGYDVRFEVLDFKGLWPLLDDGRIDTIGNIVSPNPERKEIYDFTDSYLFTEYVFLSSPDLNVESIKDLDGKSIGLVPSSAMVPVVENIEKEYGIKFKIVHYDDTATADVANGRVDLAIQNDMQAVNTVKDIGEDKIKILIGSGVYSETAYPFVKDNENAAEKRELVNKAIQELIKDGTAKEISEKWFGKDYTHKK